MVALAPERREQLAERFDGVLTGPDDPSYETLRRCFNGMVDKHPLLIAECRGTADVAAAVRFAVDEGLEVAVRGGGHSPAGRAVCDGGLVVDLGPMHAVDVDPQARLARVQGGARWRDVNREAGLHGLAVTGGLISSTGVGGYTLGGGLGWLMGLHGLAADNLVEAEVVLASGEVVRAGEDEHPDLFWAIRSGGGNFGVVTSFVFRLHPHGEVVGGLIAHPLEAAPELLRFYREFTAEVPDELTIFAALVHAPDGSGVPLGALAVCHAGEREAAQRDLQPLKEWGTPAMVEIAPIPYPVMGRLLDETAPEGALNYWKSSFIRELSDELIDTLVERFPACPAPLGQILIEHFHGAVTRVDPAATAVPHRRPGYNLVLPTQWLDPGATEESIAWTREIFDAITPHRADGRWLNYYDADEDEDALAAAYRGNGKRLAELKRRYDSDNVFHHNQNIAPAPVAG